MYFQQYFCDSVCINCSIFDCIYCSFFIVFLAVFLIVFLAVFQSKMPAHTTCIFIRFPAHFNSTHACKCVSMFTPMPCHCRASKHRQSVVAQSEPSSEAAASGAGAGPAAAAAGGAGNNGTLSSESPPIMASRSTTPSVPPAPLAATLSTG